MNFVSTGFILFYFILVLVCVFACVSVKDHRVERDAMSQQQQRQKLLNETNKKQLVTEFDVKLTILQHCIDAAKLPIFNTCFGVYIISSQCHEDVGV